MSRKRAPSPQGAITALAEILDRMTLAAAGQADVLALVDDARPHLEAIRVALDAVPPAHMLHLPAISGSAGQMIRQMKAAMSAETDSDLAARLGVDPADVADWKKRRAVPSSAVMEAKRLTLVAAYAQLPPDALPPARYDPLSALFISAAAAIRRFQEPEE